MKKQVIEFINAFKGKRHKKEIEELFTCGCCYWFAKILEIEFNGEIWYSPVDNHFICKIEDKLYDIEGEYIVDAETYSWENYQEIEPLESERIKKWCIDLKN